MIDDELDDDVATEEERAEAEALARALEGRPVFRAPTDALETVGLVRFERMDPTMIDARVRGVRAELDAEFARRPSPARGSRLALATFVLAAAAGIVLVVRSVAPEGTESSSSVASRPPTIVERVVVAHDESSARHGNERSAITGDPGGLSELRATPNPVPSPPGAIATSSASIEVTPSSPITIGDARLGVEEGRLPIAALERSTRSVRVRMLFELRATYEADPATSRWIGAVASTHAAADRVDLPTARALLERIDYGGDAGVDARAYALVLADLRTRRAAIALTGGDARAAVELARHDPTAGVDFRRARMLAQYARDVRIDRWLVLAAAHDALGETALASQARRRARGASAGR